MSNATPNIYNIVAFPGLKEPCKKMSFSKPDLIISVCFIKIGNERVRVFGTVDIAESVQCSAGNVALSFK